MAWPSIDATEVVAWSSDAPTVAAIAASGAATELIGLRPGTTLVQATYPDFEITPAAVSVFAGALVELSLQPVEPTFPVGLEPYPMRAWGLFADEALYDVTQSCVWSTSNTLAASISNAAGTKGFLTVLRPGAGVISAKLGALSGTTSFSVP